MGPPPANVTTMNAGSAAPSNRKLWDYLRAGLDESGLRTTFGVLGLCLLFIVLRWNSYDLPLTRDEGEYGYAAQALKAGLAPYSHAFLQKPPMIVYSYALASCLAPQLFWFPRILA